MEVLLKVVAAMNRRLRVQNIRCTLLVLVRDYDKEEDSVKLRLCSCAYFPLWPGAPQSVTDRR